MSSLSAISAKFSTTFRQYFQPGLQPKLMNIHPKNVAMNHPTPSAQDHHQAHDHAPTDWKHDGVRVVPGDQLDGNVPSTPGMDRKAAINFARVGAQKLWAGTVHIHPNAKTGAHHHGPLESVIYVVKGRARMRWGNALEFTAEAGPGDFIYVPPFVPHQEINASADEALECVLCRSDGQAIAVNMDIEPVEKPETVLWIDPTHPQGGV
jgi:uncharacterized RmlC-like cupin family protein